MTNTLTATLRTNQGDIVLRLFPDHAPETVRNFVELSQGTREWTDPRTRQSSKDRLYDGTIFHRVIPGFMIQGGDPLGTGTGGPGYKFGDEFHPDLSLPQLAGQKRDHDRDLTGAGPAQQSRDLRDLRGAPGRGRDRLRRLDQFTQQHNRIVPEGPDA